MIHISAITEHVGKNLPLFPNGHKSMAADSTHFIAEKLMEAVKWFLGLFEQQNNSTLSNAIYAVLVCAIALLVGSFVKWILLVVIHKVAARYKNDIISYLTDRRFFTKISRIIPPIVFLIFLQFTFVDKDTLAMILAKLCWVYMVFAVADALNTLIYVIWMHVDQRENKRKLPLKGLVQLVKGVVWIIVAIVVVAIIVNKSPGALLAGLGAFAAVLMLIFKDSILGVVAGVQLSENDSLHVGDWISIPGTTANGTVIEVSLTSVKVLNWDKTITTVPPYSLVSGSFQNYRNMQESHTRRINRTFLIDTDSVVFTTPEMLDEFRKIPYMNDYITQKLAQQRAGKVENVANSAGLADGSLETNLGLLRAYMKMYLDHHPAIDKESLSFVCTQQQSANGIPFQIYCFTNTSVWTQYEGIQSEIFEHFGAVLSKFNLYTYENASGRDNLLEGYLEAGGKPEILFGMPAPFFLPDNQPSASSGKAPSAEPGHSDQSAPVTPAK